MLFFTSLTSRIRRSRGHVTPRSADLFAFWPFEGPIFHFCPETATTGPGSDTRGVSEEDRRPTADRQRLGERHGEASAALLWSLGPAVRRGPAGHGGGGERSDAPSSS